MLFLTESALNSPVYSLWKKPDLLPFLSTPAAVVPKLVSGADLMIPGGQLLSDASLVHNYLIVFLQASRATLRTLAKRPTCIRNPVS
jgi:hypothetical protein